LISRTESAKFGTVARSPVYRGNNLNVVRVSEALKKLGCKTGNDEVVQLHKQITATQRTDTFWIEKLQFEPFAVAENERRVRGQNGYKFLVVTTAPDKDAAAHAVRVRHLGTQHAGLGVNIIRVNATFGDVQSQSDCVVSFGAPNINDKLVSPLQYGADDRVQLEFVAANHLRVQRTADCLVNVRHAGEGAL